MLRRYCRAAATLVAVPVLFVACSDDEPSDENFVTQLCEASAELRTDLEAAIQAASTQTDSGKAVGLLVEPLEKFVKAFKDSDPPDDLDEWHDEASDRLQATVDAFKREQSLSALVGFSDSPIPDPPAEAKQRLRDAAEDVVACDGVAFLKPD